MGDPFADLLMRFKGDESVSQMKMKDEGLLNGSQDSKDFAKQSSSMDALQPNMEKSSSSSKIDDDLEKLFSITSNTRAIDGEGKEDLTAKQNQSNLDPFFDPLQITPEKPRQNVESEPTQAVDEARDREVVKLMSLGYSIDDANRSYDNNVLYDDLVREAKEKKLRMRRLQRQMAEARWENENPVSTVENNNGGEGNVNFLSMASDIFNKGKELVDQFSLFPDEKHNDTLQPSSTGELEQKRFAKPVLPRRPRKDYDLISEIQDELPGNDKRWEYSPPTNQGRKGSLSVSETDESVALNPPQLNGTLLDFDDSPVNGSSVSITATKQESQSPALVVPITEIELSGYDEFKNRARELFKTGDYVTAVQEYEKTLNTLPQGHPLRIISYSNLMASQLKTGQYKESLGVASTALELFPEDTAQWSQIIQNSEPARTYGDMWIKIILRQAEAFEHLENFSGALTAYQSLIEKNFCTYKVMEGRRRCQKVLSPERYKVVRREPVDAENPLASSNLSSKEYGNLRNVKENNRKQAEEESQRHALYDKVYEQIKEWESDRANDIRHLLSNLQKILPWVNWKPVSSAELVMPKKVKGTYLRAVTKTHPDKVPDSLALEKKMIAENVFSRLSSAWEKFKTENDIR